MQRTWSSIKETVATAIGRPPPLLVPQGMSTTISWCLFIVLNLVLKVSFETCLWIMYPSIGVIFFAVDAFSKKLPPRTCWIMGFAGWTGGLIAVWLYAYTLR
jgi:hypothetical protein